MHKISEDYLPNLCFFTPNHDLAPDLDSYELKDFVQKFSFWREHFEIWYVNNVISGVQNPNSQRKSKFRLQNTKVR